MNEAEIGSLLGKLAFQEGQMLPDPQFILGEIVEDIERNLIADPLAAQKIWRRDLRQDGVQSFC
ncbi:MAG: hypothetical protein R3C56_39955 [Pirellulaceae bacterium]